jgi:hypothetical protein
MTETVTPELQDLWTKSDKELISKLGPPHTPHSPNPHADMIQRILDQPHLKVFARGLPVGQLQESPPHRGPAVASARRPDPPAISPDLHQVPEEADPGP